MTCTCPFAVLLAQLAAAQKPIAATQPGSPADFRAFLRSLSDEREAAFAQAAGTTVGNLRAHWAHARRVPRSAKAMERLFMACTLFGAKFSKQQLLAFFYDSTPSSAGNRTT